MQQPNLLTIAEMALHYGEQKRGHNRSEDADQKLKGLGLRIPKHQQDNGENKEDDQSRLAPVTCSYFSLHPSYEAAQRLPEGHGSRRRHHVRSRPHGFGLYGINDVVHRQRYRPKLDVIGKRNVRLLNAVSRASLKNAGGIAGGPISEQQSATVEHDELRMDTTHGIVGDRDIAVLITPDRIRNGLYADAP